jgi:hypothetical protein
MLGSQLVDERSERSRWFAPVVSRKHLAEIPASPVFMTLSWTQEIINHLLSIMPSTMDSGHVDKVSSLAITTSAA